MDSREITEWQVYEQIVGPLGEKRLDYLVAWLGYLLIEPWRDHKKRARPFEVEDFLLFGQPEQDDFFEESASEKVYERMKRLTVAMGGEPPD